MNECMLTDPELGEIRLRTNARARRLTFRVKDGSLWASLPPGTALAEVRRAVEQLRPRLRAACLANRRAFIDLGYCIETDFFRLSLAEGNVGRFLSRSSANALQIVCPPGTDFRDPALQDWLHKVVVEALRRRAKEILPARLDGLARRHDLAYRQVRINTGHTRWGSCSAGRNINLSCYLLLLPGRLVDYVLLHELAHTREMNHGERFWKLLDELTGGKAQLLRREMKQYRTALPAAPSGQF